MSFDSSYTPDLHPNWHDLLAGYALGNLSPEEQVTFEQLLTEHPELKREAQAYQETLALVPYSLAPQPLPVGLEDAIVAAAAQGGRQLSSKNFLAQTRQSQPRRQWYGVAIAAALLMAAVMGADGYRLRQQQARLKKQLTVAQTQLEEQQQQLAQAKVNAAAIQAAESFEQVVDILRQPNALVYSLQGTDNASTSSGSLLTLPDHSEVQLVSHNLPVLPDDQVYRLWSVATEEAAPMFCGQFNNTESGNVQWTVPDALCNATPVQVIITVDAAVDPPVPKGPAVLTGNI